MEETIKEKSSVPASSEKLKQRYALRSGTKSKEGKPPVSELSNASASASRRERCGTTVSKSVGVLDLTGKDSSAKPPRRFSIPAKTTASPAPKIIGNITPISETRMRRNANTQGKSETPLSDVSRSASRKKFSVLTSASYWLSQIKLSESAAKHSISLGFFKLALEAQCEPLQRMRDELKSYANRHNLVELGEPVKELFESYNMSASPQQLQVSETCSLIPEAGTRSSDEDVHSSSSTGGARKLKPKSLNTDVAQVSSESAKKDAPIQKTTPATRVRGSLNKNSANSTSVSETGGRKLQKKPQKPSKQESNKGKDNVKKQGKKSASEEGTINPLPAEDSGEENKENMEAPPMEEISLTEA